MSFEGLVRAETDFGIQPIVYESLVEADYATYLEKCVSDGNDLCISVGFPLAGATLAAANAHPATKFAIVDYSNIGLTPGNLRSLIFDVRQPSYLAGALAALMSQSKIVGDVAGMAIPTVTAFTEAFHNGALYAVPDATILLVYTGVFDNPTLGVQTAQDMMSSGADVIFGPAGSTGSGAVLYATQHGDWGIGVDTDWYSSVFGDGIVAGSDKLLTSVLKKVDQAVYLTIEDLVTGHFTGGEVVYGPQNGGTALAPFHETDPLIPQAIKNRLEAIEMGLMSGKINPASPVCSQYIFLPQLIK